MLKTFGGKETLSGFYKSILGVSFLCVMTEDRKKTKRNDIHVKFYQVDNANQKTKRSLLLFELRLFNKSIY